MSEPSRSDVSSQLRREVAMLAADLANLLERGGVTGLGPIDDAREFLRGMVHAAGGEKNGAAATPLDRLVARLDLSRTERTLLLLAGMPEEHEGYSTLMRALHPRGEPRPTVALLAQLIADGLDAREDLRHIVESSALIRSGAALIPTDGPLFERSMLTGDGIWSALHGLDVWPRGLHPVPTSASAAGLDDWLTTPAAMRAQAALRSSDTRLVLITADTEDIALHRATLLARAAGAQTAAFGALPAERQDAERLIGAHCLLRNVIPVFRLGTSDDAGPAGTPPELATFPGPIIVAARRGRVRMVASRPAIHVDIDRVSTRVRHDTWRQVMPGHSAIAADLAARYSLDPAQIAVVARDVASLGALEDTTDTDDLAASVRLRSNLSFTGAGLHLRRATATREALVLAPDRMAQLQEATDRLRMQSRVLDDWGFLANRPGARGVRMLFSGPPGTGKTLAAEVMAAELGVDLLVVDIPRVISKWIGETEKNLAEVFDAAERAQAVLFFDEADAFFGKRTEISDAHDRYANFETAYLLSRLERFEGLAVLATNLRQNIDPAFLRRLEFVVDFDEPAAEQRAAIWRCHIPSEAAVAGDVHLDEIAGLYAIVGGLIRNAAVAAAFLAAARGSTAITRQHFIHAIAREYEKAGKAFPGMPGAA